MTIELPSGRRIIDGTSPSASDDARMDFLMFGSVFIQLPGASAPKMSDTPTP